MNIVKSRRVTPYPMFKMYITMIHVHFLLARMSETNSIHLIDPVNIGKATVN